MHARTHTYAHNEKQEKKNDACMMKWAKQTDTREKKENHSRKVCVTAEEENEVEWRSKDKKRKATLT